MNREIAEKLHKHFDERLTFDVWLEELKEFFRISIPNKIRGIDVRIIVDMEKENGNVNCALTFDGIRIPKDEEKILATKKLAAKINTQEMIKAVYIESDVEGLLVLQLTNRGCLDRTVDLERMELIGQETIILADLGEKYIKELVNIVW